MLRKLLFLAIALASLVALMANIVLVLCKEEYATAGILRLNFNLTGGLADQIPSPPPALRDRGLLDDIQSGAKSALDAAATKVVDATDQAQTVISSAAASVWEEVEERVPQNCSLGTKRFCVGYRHEQNCSDLPFDISSLLPVFIEDLPAPMADAIRERVGALSSLAGSLNVLSELYVLETLVSGLILMTIVTILSMFVAFGWPLCAAAVLQSLNVGLRALVLLILAMMCCSPLIVLASVLHAILRAADGLPSWVGVDRGGAYGLCFGALACALFLALLITGAPAINEGSVKAQRKKEG